MQNELSVEQIKDIEGRVEKAKVLLKELNLAPAAIVSKVTIGEGKFADQVQCYLQDTKYNIKSPYITTHA